MSAVEVVGVTKGDGAVRALGTRPLPWPVIAASPRGERGVLARAALCRER